MKSGFLAGCTEANFLLCLLGCMLCLMFFVDIRAEHVSRGPHFWVVKHEEAGGSRALVSNAFQCKKFMHKIRLSLLALSSSIMSPCIVVASELFLATLLLASCTRKRPGNPKAPCCPLITEIYPRMERYECPPYKAGNVISGAKLTCVRYCSPMDKLSVFCCRVSGYEIKQNPILRPHETQQRHAMCRLPSTRAPKKHETFDVFRRLLSSEQGMNK